MSLAAISTLIQVSSFGTGRFLLPFTSLVNEELRCLAGTRVIVDVTVLKAQLDENGYALALGGASAAAAQEALV